MWKCKLVHKFVTIYLYIEGNTLTTFNQLTTSINSFGYVILHCMCYSNGVSYGEEKLLTQVNLLFKLNATKYLNTLP